VRDAVAAGTISTERYESYISLRDEIEDSERKWAPYAAASRQQKRR
jgi:hypothetical protein